MTSTQLPHSFKLLCLMTAGPAAQKTRVVRRSLNPMFNHTMVYDGFGPADLRQACAELSLWDHGALGSRQLGRLRLSTPAPVSGAEPWGPDARGGAPACGLGQSLSFPELGVH